MSLPKLIRHENGFSLEIDGKPSLLLGGQIHNSSSSSREHLEKVVAKVSQLNYNFFIAPVSWSELEPSEGNFDFEQLENLVSVSRKFGLRLVLIWFGAFKNAKSTYAPTWVRRNVDRFPRALNSATGNPSDAPTLSVFSEELLNADSRAFSRLMSRIAEIDEQGTIVMIQIENEMGLLGSSRDYSEPAEAQWSLSELPDTWQGHEVFMAKQFALYANTLAGLGKAIKNLPMYVNAWLGPQPGQSEAGQWPSGGPSSLVLDIWKEHAPLIDILTPDIYVHEAVETMATYHRPDNALFIPESRHIVGNLLWALGNHAAIGYSMFGAEDGRVGNQMSMAYSVLTQCESLISTAQSQRKIRALLLGHPGVSDEIEFGQLRIRAKDSLSSLKRFIDVAGVDLQINPPKQESELEVLPVIIDSPSDQRPSALVIQMDEDEFILMGRGINLEFYQPGLRIEIDEIEEGTFHNGNWIPKRKLNGDERLNHSPIYEFGCAKIRILKFA